MAALQSADVVIEGEYHTGAQEYVYLEPQGMQAEPTEDVVIIRGSMQCPCYIVEGGALLLGLPSEKVRVIPCATGGGFGGKEVFPTLIAGHTALLAHKAKQPVRLIYDRVEDLRFTIKRHPARVRHKTGWMRDDRLVACKSNWSLTAERTAHSVRWSCSGRRFMRRGPISAITSTSRLAPWPPIIRRAERSEDSERRSPCSRSKRTSAATSAGRFRRRGIGLSLFMHGTGLNGNAEGFFKSEVLLRGNSDGTVSVLTDQMEFGQGTQTIVAQLVAEGLRVPVEWVVAEEPDTAESPNSGPTVASRTAAVVGGLLIMAGQRFRDKVEHRSGGPILDTYAFRSAVAELVSQEPLLVRVSYRPPSDFHWDEDTQQGDAYLAYTWSCCVVALEVDTLTGEVKVLDVTAVQDVGCVVHPLFATGQVEGGVTQALGWALMENCVWSDGVMQNANMTDYTIPTAMDVSPMRVVFLEHPHPRFPHGAKGLGQPPAEGLAPAVVNALRQALGIHFNRVSITPEIILPAWEDRPS